MRYWLRIHLPRQGTQVHSPPQKIPHAAGQQSSYTTNAWAPKLRERKPCCAARKACVQPRCKIKLKKIKVISVYLLKAPYAFRVLRANNYFRRGKPQSKFNVQLNNAPSDI